MILQHRLHCPASYLPTEHRPQHKHIIPSKFGTIMSLTLEDTGSSSRLPSFFTLRHLSSVCSKQLPARFRQISLQVVFIKLCQAGRVSSPMILRAWEDHISALEIHQRRAGEVVRALASESDFWKKLTSEVVRKAQWRGKKTHGCLKMERGNG
jgi:hypothetical protein